MKSLVFLDFLKKYIYILFFLGIELLECKNSIDDVHDEDEVDGSEMEDEEKDVSCCGKSKRLYHFLMESTEYHHPDIYGFCG